MPLPPHLYYDVHGISNTPYVLASDYDALVSEHAAMQADMEAELQAERDACDAFRRALVATVAECRRACAERDMLKTAADAHQETRKEYRPPIETVCPSCHAKTIGPCMNAGCQARSDPTW